MHGDSSFITLTYDEEKLPHGRTLVPKHLQDWLKRIRKEVSPVRLRYYAVGEYGDTSFRPHYHVALFGYPGCSFGRSTYSRYRNRCCPRCDLVQDTWGQGNILVGQLEQASAQYLVGYVIKKMTSMNDHRLLGRHPEFARMSLKPGIGAHAMSAVAATVDRFNLDKLEGDVPSALRHGKKILPLGRYLRRKLRLALDLPPDCPEHVQKKISEEMLSLYEASINSAEFLSPKQALLQKDAQKAASVEARLRIFKKRENL